MPAPPASSILSSHDGDWLTAKELEYPVGFALPKHHHEDACIQVVLGGIFHEAGWGDGGRFSPGEAIFRPAGFEHANAQADGLSVGLSVRLDSRGVPEQVADSVRHAPPVRMLDPHVGSLAARLSREMSSPDGLSATIIDALCVEMVVRVLRAATGSAGASSSSRLADKAAHIIRQRAAGPLSVESVAKELGTDRFRLNRAFLKHKGCCPAEFIRLCRVDMAQRLLLQTNRPIAFIAGDCGFADQSHMTKAFKLTVGVSPARFRAQRGDR